MAVDDPTNPSDSEIEKSLGARAESLTKQVEDLKKFNDELRKTIDKEDNILVKLEREKALREQIFELREKENRLLEIRIKMGEEVTAQEISANKALQSLNKVAKKTPSLVEIFLGGEKGGEKLISEISGIGKSIQNDLNKNMQNAMVLDFDKIFDAKNLTGGLKGALIASGKEAALQFGKAFSAAAVALLAKYAFDAIKLASSLADMEAGFMKSTGASKEFARSVTVAFRNTREFGASAEDTSKAAQALFGTFTDFTFQNEKTREQLIETTAVLDKLGIDSQTTAKSIQFMTKSMGMSPGGAAQSMLNLEKFAENLGVPVKQLGADFVANASSLGKLGSNGEAAFKRLAIAAKTTGLEISKILNLTNNFDTFEGAATQAGKLNAALGGNFVNAMDLMMATDPAERFGLIRDSILDAGLSFDSMSYYQRKFYADSLGLSDVNDLALMLSGNMDMVAGATQQSSQSIEDAAKRAREMATLQEKLNILFAQMIPILTPVIDLLTDMAQFLSDNARIVKTLAGYFTLLTSAIVLVASIMTGNFVTGGGALAGMALGFALLADNVKVGSDKISLFGLIIERIFDALSIFLSPFKEFLGDSFEMVGIFVQLTDKMAEFDELMILISIGLTNMLAPLKLLAYLLKVLMVPMRLLNAIFISFGTGLLEFFTSFKKGEGVIKSFANASMAFLSTFATKFGTIFLQLFSPLTRLADPIYTIVGLFKNLDDELNILGVTIFKKTWSSNFVEGLMKLGNAFSFIKSMIVAVLSPINTVISGFERIGNAYVNLPFLNLGAANANVNVTNTTAGTNNAATSGGTNKIQQPIQIEINGNKLAEFVLEVTGERLYSVAALQK